MPDGNLSKGMRHLNGVYTQRFNRRHRLVGHLFQGRYKAILDQKEAYLLELSRYIVLNPVRAGMVAAPENWRWSSYLATIGDTEIPPFLFVDWILSAFSDSRRKAGKQYREFVVSGLDAESPWLNLVNQIYLGTDDFVEEVQGKLKKISR